MEAENPRTPPVISTGEWIITILITAIPLVNIIMLFVWGFGSSTNPNKANWAKASLIWILIAFVLGFIFSAIFGAAMFSAFDEAGQLQNME